MVITTIYLYLNIYIYKIILIHKENCNNIFICCRHMETCQGYRNVRCFSALNFDIFFPQIIWNKNVLIEKKPIKIKSDFMRSTHKEKISKTRRKYTLKKNHKIKPRLEKCISSLKHKKIRSGKYILLNVFYEHFFFIYFANDFPIGPKHMKNVCYNIFCVHFFLT